MGLNIGLIGAGFVGQVHLACLLKLPEINEVSLADSDEGLLEKAAGRFNLKNAFKDYRTLMDSKTVDIIDICLPHDLHYPVSLEAFAASKHVIVEKPISNTLAEADAMISAAADAKKRLYVALNERFLPVHQKAKEIINNGTIGAAILANLTIAGSELPRMDLPEHWKGTIGRAGGGALADSGTHLIDLAHFWFGVPQGVSCQIKRSTVAAENKAEDTAALILTYPDFLANLGVTYASQGEAWTEIRQIWGQKGSIHIQLENNNPLLVWNSGRASQVDVEHHTDWWPYSVSLGLAHAIRCFYEDKLFDVTPEEGREILKTIRAAYRSADENCLVQRDLYSETISSYLG